MRLLTSLSVAVRLPAALRHGSLLLLALGAAACGRGWDTTYGCEQTIACARSMKQAVPDQRTCEATADAVYAKLTDDQKAVADAAFEACAGKTGCDFEACVMIQ